MQEERPDRYFIPDNLNDKRHFFHIPDRNLAETGVAELVVFYVVKLIPITDIKIKITVGAILMIIIGVVGMMGIKNESVTEFIMTSVKFQKKKRVLHYRRCDQKDYDTKEQKTETGGRSESKAEQLLKKLEDSAAQKIEQKIEDRKKKNAS